MSKPLTVKQVRELLADKPDNQPVMVQIDDENGYFCKEVISFSEKALWTGANRDQREIQLYLHIYVPLSPESAE